jgi:hypothetical protein
MVDTAMAASQNGALTSFPLILIGSRYFSGHSKFFFLNLLSVETRSSYDTFLSYQTAFSDVAVINPPLCGSTGQNAFH